MEDPVLFEMEQAFKQLLNEALSVLILEFDLALEDRP